MVSRDWALDLTSRICDGALREIAHKVLSEERISEEDGLYLFEKADLASVGLLANWLREKRHGQHTYFNRNFHIEPTNVCVYSCKFCSYSRLIKNRDEGWEYSHDEIMEIFKSFDDKPVTEVHIVGGVMPKYDLDFYLHLFREIKRHRPDIHLKALTPVEYHYIFKKAKVDYEEGLQMVAESGVDSLPGGGAEIFDESIREKIAGDKCTSAQWLRIHEIWHSFGRRSNATILYGHIENYRHRLDHMARLRALQDRTGGFQTFIPLKFRNKDNEMSYLPEVNLLEDLRMYAVSRIFLDNFDHIKAYWPMLGRHNAQLTLAFGVDDLDGTIDDTTKIYSMAGSEEQKPEMTTRQLVQLIKQAGRVPVERDSYYRVLANFEHEAFENVPVGTYFPLPTASP